MGRLAAGLQYGCQKSHWLVQKVVLMKQYNVVDTLVSIVKTVCCEAPSGTFDSRGASVSPHMS